MKHSRRRGALAAALCALLALSTLPAGAAQDGAPPAESPAESPAGAPERAADAVPAFPPTTALEAGLSPDSLAKLDDLVANLAAEGEVVGAELLVIKGGKTVLHTAHGMRDVEGGAALEPNSVFCVRSMTKPLVGAAIGMLIDDDLLELDDRVGTHLPAFDREPTRDITVEQLLLHTSGMPMSYLFGHDPRELTGIDEVAALGVGRDLLFEPGTRFHYSDQGTDTLTALIEAVSGTTARDYVRTRVLEPLGMTDSVLVFARDDPRRARACTAYAGSKNAWTAFWTPRDEPLFGTFLGSQSMYSTTVDYAKFLQLWMNRGRVDRQRVLRAKWVRETLQPGPHPMRGPTGFPDAETAYGRLMQLWTAPTDVGDGERDVIAFGHSGSDGTWAWAFPEHDTLVLYFTQSRGNITGVRVEAALGELILGEPFDANQLAPPFEQYVGYYWEGPGDRYRSIVPDGDDLALEILGKGVVPLDYIGEDRWRLRPQPANVLQFHRDAAGVVTGYSIGEHREFRFEPGAELPDIDELAARVAAAHGMAKLAEVGPMRRSGTWRAEQVDMGGTVGSLVAWPDRMRDDVEIGEDVEVSAFDGDRVWVHSSLQPRQEVEGDQLRWMRDEFAPALFGDWREHYPVRRVVQEYELDGRRVWMVRLGGVDGPATTVYVDAETNLVVGTDSFAVVPSLGRVGKRQRFLDHRDVQGMQWPARVNVVFAGSPVGVLRVAYDEFELGVDVPEGAFELRDYADE